MDLQLERLRKAKGLTQQQLAEKIGVTKRIVGAWERGETALSLEHACAICNLLDITLDELAGRKASDIPERLHRVFAQLDPVGQARAEAYIDGLADKT